MKEKFNLDALQTLGSHMSMGGGLKNKEITPQILAQCPSCNDHWGRHNGNICKAGDGFWPLEEVLKIKRRNGKLASMDNILNLILEKVK